MYKDLKVALVYDKLFRFDTIGEYCKRALAKLCRVKHFLPIQMNKIAHEYDLYINIDDSLQYVLPPHLKPSAFWVIDTHLQYEWDLVKARTFDRVFVAQIDGMEKLANDKITNLEYLPVACDPDIHRKFDCAKKYDVCFVGNAFQGARRDLLEFLRSNIDNLFIGNAYFEEMAKIYSESRIVFNRSIKNDINMRVFEALSCGSLLVTNNLDDNGLSAIFQDKKHLVTYNDRGDLLEKIIYYLENTDQREAIAAQGQREVVEKHTYDHRMMTLLERCLESLSVSGAQINSEMSRPDQLKLISIIVLTHNEIEHTKKCLDSIISHTDIMYEIIIVDNASSDNTIEFLEQFIEHHMNIRVVLNRSNLGYPAGINRGLSLASGDYILFLNNDTIVTQGWLRRMLKVFIENPQAGIVGPMTNNISGPQKVENVTYQSMEDLQFFAENWYRQHSGQTFSTSRVVGFCMLVSKEVIDRIGGMDERFGIGNFEDDDFSLRAQRMGYKPLIAKDVFIHHEGGQTFKGAQIDYRKCMLEAWKIFSLKWNLPEEFPVDRTYSADLQVLDPSKIFIQIPDIHSTHTNVTGSRIYTDELKK